MKQLQSCTYEHITENTFDLIGKDWMLVTAKYGDKVNTMTASWGGLGIMWKKEVAFVVIRPQRYTKEFIDAGEEFSLTFFSKEYKKQLSYLGSISGRDEDKITKSGLTLEYAQGVPYFEEGKLVLLCKKLFASPFEASNFIDPTICDTFYPNKDFHELYIAEITGVMSK